MSNCFGELIDVVEDEEEERRRSERYGRKWLER